MKNLITKQDLESMMEYIEDSVYDIKPKFITNNALHEDEQTTEEGFIVTDGGDKSLVVYLDGTVSQFEEDGYDSYWEEYLIEDLLEELSEAPEKEETAKEFIARLERDYELTNFSLESLKAMLS